MQNREIDFSTIFGIFMAICLIAYGIKIDGNLLTFVDFSSFCIVVLGTFFVTTACFSFKEVIESHSHIFKMIVWSTIHPKKVANQTIELAALARTKTFEELEKMVSKDKYHSFIKRGIMMIVDGKTLAQIEEHFNEEISSSAEQQAKVITILRKSAEVSPAMGLIGTLIGLVGMLSNLNDLNKIGPSMALALLTTFYGAMLAYIVFFPLASKLERNTKEEILAMRIYLRTILSIAQKENPRILESSINSLLAPSDQVTYFA